MEVRPESRGCQSPGRIDNTPEESKTRFIFGAQSNWLVDLETLYLALYSIQTSAIFLAITHSLISLSWICCI